LLRSPQEQPSCAVSVQEVSHGDNRHALTGSGTGVDTGLGSMGEMARAMSLSSVGNPAWQTIRGVRFGMRHGPTLVPVLVTNDAVDDIEKATAGDGGSLARFSKHRDRFEVAASAKHQRGQLEEDGLVIVDVADLKSAGH
jgi:hypothetical protein